MHSQEVSDTHGADANWRLWCRLCAKEDAQNNFNIFFKKEYLCRTSDTTRNGAIGNDSRLVEAVRKYFWVNITSVDELPKMLCTDCFTRVTSMVNFSERVCKVQQMFWELRNSHDNTKLHVESLRLKYGLLYEESEHAIEQQLPEVHYVEEKPIIDELEDTIFEEKTIAQNPLESASVSLKKKKKILGKLVKAKTGDVYDANDKDFKNETGSEKDDVDDGNFREARKRTTKTRKQRMKLTVSQQQLKPPTTSIKRQCQAKQKLKSTKRSETSLRKASENMKDTKDDDAEKLVDSDMINLEIETESEASDKHDEDFVPPKYIKEKGKETEITDSQQDAKVTKRAPKVKSIVECDVCKKIFPYQSTLRRHQEVHTSNKHTCPVCGLQLNTRSTFRDHMVVHSDVMKYKCTYCGRGFKRIKTMQNHLILHTGLKPFLCEFCGRTFPTSVNCRTHKTLAHRKELAAIEALKASSGRKTLQNQIEKSQISM